MKKVGALMMCILMLSGCGNRQTAAICKVVTGVEVQYQQRGEKLERTYIRQESIGSVMNYLRMLKPAGQVIPEGSDSGSCRIIVHYSYGPDKVFLQQGNDYLQQDGGVWKRIDRQQAQLLYPLLLLLPSDA